MKQKIFVLAGFLSILLLWTGCPNNAPVPAGSGSGSSGGGGNTPVVVNFSVEGGNGTLKAFVDGSEITDGATVQIGKTVTFVSAPNKGFRVKNWTGAGVSKIYPDWKNAKLTVSAASNIKVEFHADVAASNPYPANDAIQYTTANAAKASNGIGKTHGSVQLGKRPRADGYATVGDDGTGTGIGTDSGSFRIPSIVKTTVNGNTRLIAAFDVRYRGEYRGNGDVGQGTTKGSDITVMYSDNGGATWTPAKNKVTGQKPAIDVKNTYGPDGTGVTYGKETDVCDPQLTVFPNGTIYCGMAGGAGTLGNNGTLTNFRFFKSTDDGETWEEDTDPVNGYTRNWNTSDNDITQLRANFTTPGHGIVLKRQVPGVASMAPGTVVLPCLGWDVTKSCGMYLAHGTGEPSTWNPGPSGNSSPWGKFGGGSKPAEEGQICQLDNGNLLMASKSYFPNPASARLNVFTNNTWHDVTADDFNGGGACQVSVLKIADGNGTDKYGIVAVCRSMEAPANAGTNAQGAGRGNITVGFARDLSAKAGTPVDNPLDTDRYYINIRAEQMSYFGYTDMVMINDHTLGVLYENWWKGDESINGMRFVAIDVSKIIENLSVKP